MARSFLYKPKFLAPAKRSKGGGSGKSERNWAKDGS